MEGLFEGAAGERLRKVVLVGAVFLAIFIGVKALAELQGLRYIGAGLPATNTISVSGYGEALGVPDIATFSFSITSLKPTVAAAQEEVTTKVNAVTQFLKDSGVDEKDIKTSDYSVYPQYDYQQSVCPAGVGSEAYYCAPGRQVLKGYEVRQTTSIKVRDTEKAGDLLSGVGSKGATEVSGLNFTFDDPDAIQKEARDEAIADAKDKAEELAKQLGVRLVRVVSYGDSGNYPGPLPYYRSDVVYGMGGVANETKAVAPDISIGENKVVSNVTITYEIR